jgi:hypothetical protein
MHDPGEILLDVALAVALGGADGLADVGILQAESVVFGLVASDSTVSWLIDTLASATEGPACSPNSLPFRCVVSKRNVYRTPSW